MNETELWKNYQEVEDRIREACGRCGRDPQEVTLVAVSKTKPAEMIMALYKEGVREFGENRPQEMRDKREICPEDIRWHMIGHLQKNKIKYVVERTALIHSVDSYELAEAIDLECEKKGIHSVDILLEVNMAEEESKWGLLAEDTPALAARIAQLSHVHICGLMTVAPFVEDPEENRPIFRRMRQLGVDIASQNIDNVSMSVLSMGMTNDYAIAIEEGATIIRVGTAIFGGR